jgi:hypothetical protein
MFSIVETGSAYQLGYNHLTATYYKRVSLIKRGKVVWSDWFRSDCFAGLV